MPEPTPAFTAEDLAARPPIDLSDPERLQRYLVACLSESGARYTSWHARFKRACSWYAHLLAQGYDRAPFFVVFDLGFLILEGDAFPFRCLNDQGGAAPTRDGEAAAARQRHIRYENRLLSRFLTLPVFRALRELLEEASDIDGRVVVVLEAWLRPLLGAPLPSIQAVTHAVRQLGPPGRQEPEALAARVADALDDPDHFARLCEALVARYESVPLQQLLGPEDLFVLRHLEALSSRAQRLIARQIAEVEVALGVVEPPPAHLRREAPQISVDLDDAGFFPQGGLDQLANRGSIENLVRTELAYLEDDEVVDLFTLRYVEGELLYYTRDEGQLMRRSRTIHVALQLTHAHHILYPGHPARLAIMLQAAINRLVDDLFELFESDAVVVALHVSGQGASEVAELWRIRFRDAIDRGEVSVTHRSSPFALEGALAEQLVISGRLTSLILFDQAPEVDAQTRTTLQLDGLGLLTVRCPWIPPPAAAADDDDAAAGPQALALEAPEPTPPGGGAFRLPLEGAHVVERLRELRRALIWRLFGC